MITEIAFMARLTRRVNIMEHQWNGTAAAPRAATGVLPRLTTIVRGTSVAPRDSTVVVGSQGVCQEILPFVQPVLKSRYQY